MTFHNQQMHLIVFRKFLLIFELKTIAKYSLPNYTIIRTIRNEKIQYQNEFSLPQTYVGGIADVVHLFALGSINKNGVESMRKEKSLKKKETPTEASGVV